MHSDTFFLTQAVELAKQSQEPIKCACILVDQTGRVVAQEFNSQRADGLIASHAEMKAIATANRLIGRKLVGLSAYCNSESCTMCLTALILARVDRVVFAHRFNDFVEEARKVHIDCFEFVKRFPHAPQLIHLELR